MGMCDHGIIFLLYFYHMNTDILDAHSNKKSFQRGDTEPSDTVGIRLQSDDIIH